MEKYVCIFLISHYSSDEHLLGYTYRGVVETDSLQDVERLAQSEVYKFESPYNGATLFKMRRISDNKLLKGIEELSPIPDDSLPYYWRRNSDD